MKHIVKFNQAANANNYEIKNIPFLTTIGENNQLLTCNEENKKIVIDSQGNASIDDAGPVLISFTIGGTTYQAESGMSWTQWVDSDYNINPGFDKWSVQYDAYFDCNVIHYAWYSSDAEVYYYTIMYNDSPVSPSDYIQQNVNYDIDMREN